MPELKQGSKTSPGFTLAQLIRWCLLGMALGPVMALVGLVTCFNQSWKGGAHERFWTSVVTMGLVLLFVSLAGLIFAAIARRVQAARNK